MHQRHLKLLDHILVSLSISVGDGKWLAIVDEQIKMNNRTHRLIISMKLHMTSTTRKSEIAQSLP